MHSIHESAANGPAAAIVFWNFLKESPAQGVIDFITSTLAKIDPTNHDIFHLALPGIRHPLNGGNYEKDLILQDQAVIQLLQILQTAFKEKFDPESMVTITHDQQVVSRAEFEFLEYIKDLFFKLPDHHLCDHQRAPAFVEVKNWIVKRVVGFGGRDVLRSVVPFREINFWFLMAAYAGDISLMGEMFPKTTRYVSDPERKFIEGYLREGLRSYSAQDILICLGQPDVPTALEEILVVAWTKVAGTPLSKELILSTRET